MKIAIQIILMCFFAYQGESVRANENNFSVVHHMQCYGDNCKDFLLVYGEIPPNAAEIFKIEYSKLKYPPDAVTFNSLGGSLIGAMKLGKVIRELNLMTAVGAEDPSDAPAVSTRRGMLAENPICASACVWALAGGIDTYVGDRAKIGVHQASVNAVVDLETGQIVTQLMQDYARIMLGSGKLAEMAIRTSSQDIHWLTRDELITVGIIEQFTYSDWRLQKIGGILRLTQSIKNNRDQRKDRSVEIFKTDYKGKKFLIFHLLTKDYESPLEAKKLAELFNKQISGEYSVGWRKIIYGLPNENEMGKDIFVGFAENQGFEAAGNRLKISFFCEYDDFFKLISKYNHVLYKHDPPARAARFEAFYFEFRTQDLAQRLQELW